MKMSRSPLAPLVVAPCLLWLAPAGCAQPEASAAPPPYAVEKDAVTLSHPEVSPLRFVSAPAELGEPLPRPPVTARVSTVEQQTSPQFAALPGRVLEVRVRLGDRVKAGDRLVRVGTPELPALEREARAAALAVKTKRSLLERARQLMEARAASAQELLVAESELAEAELTLAAAEAHLASLAVGRAGNNAYWVVAQRSGTVVQLEAATGMQVGPDRERPLATVADLDSVLVIGDLPQREAQGLEPGARAWIASAGRTEAPLEGVLEAVSDVVDPERQTVPVRVRADNAKRLLKPNAFVDLSFAPEEGRAVVQVPAAAVVSDGAASVVFVEEGPGQFRRRPVSLGRQARERVEVVAGLAAGERVVVKNALLLLNALHVEG